MLRREPREPIGAAARADAAGDPDDHERIEGKAVAIVHGRLRPLFVLAPSRYGAALHNFCRCCRRCAWPQSRGAMTLGAGVSGPTGIRPSVVQVSSRPSRLLALSRKVAESRPPSISARWRMNLARAPRLV